MSPEPREKDLFSDEQKASQGNLSTAAERFLDHVEKHPAILQRVTFEPLFSALRKVIPNIPGMPREQRYGVQPWPILISTARGRELERASTGISKLVRDLPQRVLEGDAKAVAEAFGLASEAAAELLISEPNGFQAAIGRADFFDTKDGFKCLEFNAGSVGGWQDSAFSPVLLEDPEIAAFLAEHRLEPTFTDSIRVFLTSIVRDVATGPVATGGEIHLLIVTADSGMRSADDHPLEIYRQTFAEVLAATADGWSGHLEVARESEVELRGGEVWARGKRFHAVFEQRNEITDLSHALFRAFKAGQVHLYTGPISLLLGDKRSLALLSKLATSRLFTPEEQELIQTYVPWTRVVNRGRTIYCGERTTFPELLAGRRQDLVLKAAQSQGGKEVVVGRSLAAVEWDEAVSHALDDGGWVAQEYLEPRPYAFQTGEAGHAPHDVVWGSFVYGNHYGGTYARMMPRGRDAVINVSRGAVVGLVFEVDEL